MEGLHESCRGWRGGTQPQEVCALPERQDIPHSNALRPRVLLALHCRLAQPEAGVPIVPVRLHNLGARLRVPQRLLARTLPDDWGLFCPVQPAGHMHQWI